MGDSLATDLARLAPQIDVDASHDVFVRRRATTAPHGHRRTLLSMTAAALVVGLVVALVVVVRNSSSDPVATIDDGFEVLVIGDQYHLPGHLAAAGNTQQLAALWTEVALTGRPPAVDFTTSVVVAVTIADDACPPTLTRFEESGDRVITPIFVEPEGLCRQPLIPRTFVVRIDRSVVGDAFTLRLPAYLQRYGEQLLAVTVTRDGTSSRLDSPPPSTIVGPALTTVPSPPVESVDVPHSAVAATGPVTSMVAVPFGQVGAIADATILYLPDPMPVGWIVSGVISYVSPDDDVDLSGDLEAVPPVADGTYHSFSVQLTKSDGSAVAQLYIEEYPAPYELPDGLPIEPEDIGGIPRFHSVDTPENLVPALPGFETHDSWGWVQDDRSVYLEVIGVADDAVAMVTSIRRVTGAQLSTAISDGQRALLELPLIASAQLSDSLRLTARGAGQTVLAVCAESAVPTCGSIAEIYGTTGVAMTMAATGSGPQEVAWLPKFLADPLAPGPVVINGGPLGSFAYDFYDLATSGIDPASGFEMQSSIGRPREDLLGMPNIDGNLGADPSP